MMSWKRFLFLFHRWAGIVLCAFFALWFVSGIFMMYVEFPQLTRTERLAGEPELDFSTATLNPANAVARLALGDFDVVGTPSRNTALQIDSPAVSLTTPKSVELGMQFGRPAYLIHAAGGAQPRIVFADTGAVLREVTPQMAVQAATEFAQRFAQRSASSYPNFRAERIEYLDLIQTDQWTVSAGLNEHRPLHRIALNDTAGTQLYVSSRTGAVVRDAQSTERTLNYFAAVTHWLYPTFIRQYPDGWAWMVDIVSGVGTVFAISGLWIGVLRWRRNRSPGKPAVPYRGLMRWHYFTGIIFGVCLLTWVLSGLLSMNPGKLNPSRSPSMAQTSVFTGVFTGKSLRVEEFGAPAKVLPPDSVEAELLHYDAQPFYSITKRDGSRNLIAANLIAVNDEPARLPNVKKLSESAADLLPDAAIARTTLLTDYDNYYYTRHPERGEKPLPILRVEFADASRTWFHIDTITGQVTERSTKTNRLFRWLYNGLHSWDIRWLWERRPLWDIAVITFMLGGILLSTLGVVIGYRRLRY